MGVDPMLPDRSNQAEDEFVAELAAGDDSDLLVEAVAAAMAQRRPRLAGRLVGLLEGRVSIEPGSDLDRARAAAELLLFDHLGPADVSWSELDDAWSLVRSRRMRRIKRRMRASMTGSNARFGRLGHRRR